MPAILDRYWVGGTGDWNYYDPTHWSASSGGTGEASIPTSADNVHIDANSGFENGGKITCFAGNSVTCHDLICTSGHTFTMEFADDANLTCTGSITLESGMTITTTNGNCTWFMTNSPEAETLTTAGVALPSYLIIYEQEIGGTVQLQDDLTVVDCFNMQRGTFDANNKNVTSTMYLFLGGMTYFGTGTWLVQIQPLSPQSISFAVYQPTSFDYSTSTIKIDTTNALYDMTFDVDGYMFSHIWITGSGVYSVIFNGSIGYNDLRIDAGNIVKILGGRTHIMQSFMAVGEAGKLITVAGEETGLVIDTYSVNDGGSLWSVDDYFTVYRGEGSSAYFHITEIDNGTVTAIELVYSTPSWDTGVYNGFADEGGTGIGLKISVNSITASNKVFTFSQSTGTNDCDYLSLTDSDATGGAVWNAGAHSVDGGGNTGWIFGEAERKFLGFQVSPS